METLKAVWARNKNLFDFFFATKENKAKEYRSLYHPVSDAALLTMKILVRDGCPVMIMEEATKRSKTYVSSSVYILRFF